jgi:hypothetical protein
MANWPTSVSTNAQLYIAANDKSTALTVAMTNSDTTATVGSTTGFPSTGLISIDTEIIAYTGLTATTFTGLTRGQDGTTAASHLLGASVDHNVVAAHHNVLKDEIIALESSLNLTASKAAVTDASGRITTSATTASELAALNAKTASRALQTDGSGLVSTSTVTSTELGYVSGVTSAIQTQLGTKATDTLVVHLAGTETITGAKTFSTQIIDTATTNQLVLGTTNTTTISATAPAASRTITLADPGANASLVVTEGAQTINGAKTLGSAVTITPTTNQIVLGVTNTTTISATAPSASRTITLADPGANASFVTTEGAQTINGTKTFAGQLIGTGTATNDNAAAGRIGEYVSSTASGVTLTDSTYIDVTSISLTAGDWDVVANLSATPPAAGITSARIGISTTSGNSATGLTNGDTQITWNMVTTATSVTGKSIAPVRASLSATTTYYLKGYAQSTGAGNATGAGRISARRIR